MKKHVKILSDRMTMDFRGRLAIVLDKMKGEPLICHSDNDWQKLEKEIYAWHPEVQEAILHKVAHSHEPNSMEFWENVQSFTGNCFYDDNYVTIGRTMYGYPVLTWGHYGNSPEDDRHVTPDDVRRMAALYLVEKTTDCRTSEDAWMKANKAVRRFGRRYPCMEKKSKELREIEREYNKFFKSRGIRRKPW